MSLLPPLPLEAQCVPFLAALTQVEIIRSFTAKQPDELSLQVADVVLIYQRVGDGEWVWFFFLRNLWPAFKEP